MKVLACLLWAVISSTNENHAELLNLDMITGETASSMMVTDNRFLWLQIWADEQYTLASQWVQRRISAVAAILARAGGVVVKLWILCDGRALLHRVHQQGGSVASRQNGNCRQEGKHFHNNDSETAAARRFKRPRVTLHFNNAAASSLISMILHSSLHYFCLRGNGFSFGFVDW